MKKIQAFIKRNIFIIGLILYAILIFFVNYRINAFRYDNLDYGKFDLGNMSQMLWNTLNGRFLYLTDYFGANMPRWGMSHVDPILVLFLPVFYLWTNPFTLIVSQLFLFIGSAFLVYLIAKLKFKSSFVASLWGVIFLLYPAVGFITAWTGFHGVSAVVTFFLAAFYIFEESYENNSFTLKKVIIFWVLLVLTMMGKEQVPLYIVLYGVYIFLFRSGNLLSKKPKLLQRPNVRLAISMLLVGFTWFFLAFFVIIPNNAHYRIEGYRNFVRSLDLEGADTREVDLPNYFLARYDAFGDSYGEVIFNMITRPKLLINVFFGGDRVENLQMTFQPLGYLPLLHPQTLAISAADFLINYGTSAGGIGTAEISNHRISMIIPILMISSIYSVYFLSNQFQEFFKNTKVKFIHLASSITILVLLLNLKSTFQYNNPVYMWLSQAIGKRVPALNVFADEDDEEEDLDYRSGLIVGDVIRLPELDNKDRQCALKVINMIPDNVSVSGPDYLGAHLSLRETYAIYPALYNEADYVIVDVFSRKLLTILDVDLDLSRDVVSRLMASNHYRLQMGCGNLFVFKRVNEFDKPTLLPIQEYYEYDTSSELEFFQSVFVVDYLFPEEAEIGEMVDFLFTYTKRENNSLNEYVIFTTLINKDTQELYQFANLPSFAVTQPSEWKEDRFYEETFDITIPDFMEKGTYEVFIGMGNNIRTRSMYLGDMKIK